MKLQFDLHSRRYRLYLPMGYIPFEALKLGANGKLSGGKVEAILEVGTIIWAMKHSIGEVIDYEI